MTAVNKKVSFTPVFDSRKRKLRGLWKRGQNYYARLRIAYPGEDRPKTRRVPLKARDVTEALKELRQLQVKRDRGSTVTRERTPTLTDFAATYVERLYAGERKRLGTIVAEQGHARFWSRELGSHRLHTITPGQINRALDKRAGEGRSPRTLNYTLTTLRNIYSEAIADGLVENTPCNKVKWRKVDKRERRLVTAEELDRLCEAALKTSKNGQQFVDFIRLLQFTGGRLSESLRLRWADVDWDQGQLVIGAEGESKNHEARHVDFNPSLEAHLKDMLTRRDTGREWLFPSSQRGREDQHALSYRDTLLMARKASGLEHVGFHDCRHHFISMSVMAGIDYMTIAAWVGHKDGGILIGKVYGHLANEHRQRAAQKLVLGSVGIIDGGKKEKAG